MARVTTFRDLADVIIAASPSATRGAARYALRHTLHQALTADALPKQKIVDDAGTIRRWCTCCRAELPVRAGRGRPAVTCTPATGRPCKEARKRAAEIHTLRAHAGAPLMATVREWTSEI